jgi:hypothetical protein
MAAFISLECHTSFVSLPDQCLDRRPTCTSWSCDRTARLLRHRSSLLLESVTATISSQDTGIDASTIALSVLLTSEKKKELSGLLLCWLLRWKKLVMHFGCATQRRQRHACLGCIALTQKAEQSIGQPSDWTCPVKDTNILQRMWT